VYLDVKRRLVACPAPAAGAVDDGGKMGQRPNDCEETAMTSANSFGANSVLDVEGPG